MLKGTLISILLLLSSLGIYAQPLSTISGKVVEAGTDNPLPGASVALISVSGDIIDGTMTDGFGTFIIKTHETGDYNLEISFIGFDKYRVELTLDGQYQNLGKIQLTSSSMQLEGVTVRGSMEEKQRALNIQRNADNIKNVVSSDLIGRFPDLNVAEALQRVPGINIQRDKGEGSTVSIRGTPQHFTSIQINGEQLASVQQDGSRNEALDLIPADQLSTMEITKAPTPDMDGDAIGGVVNLKTPIARKNDWALRSEAALGYNDISGNLNGIGKLRVDKRFFISDDNDLGKMGVILGASYYENNNSEDRIDGRWRGLPVPIRLTGEEKLVLDNYQYRTTQNVRTRTGITGTVDYRFNKQHNLVFKYMYNKREDEDTRNRLRFDMDRGSSVYQTLDSITDGRIRKDINISDKSKENHNFNLEGNHHLNAWKARWSAFYTTSKRKYASDRGDFARDEIDVVVDNPGGIYQDVPHFREARGEQSMYDPFLYSDFRRYE